MEICYYRMNYNIVPTGLTFWGYFPFSTDILSLRDILSFYYYVCCVQAINENKQIRQPTDDISVEQNKQYNQVP
jgi:hypothetical protein